MFIFVEQFHRQTNVQIMKAIKFIKQRIEGKRRLKALELASKTYTGGNLIASADAIYRYIYPGATQSQEPLSHSGNHPSHG